MANFNNTKEGEIMYSFSTKEELLQFISDNIISTGEAAEILGCSRQNINDLVKRGKLTPVKQINYIMLFLKDDIMSRIK